jgi:hypothetical protein
MTRLPRRRSPLKQLVLLLDVQQARPDHWTNRIGDFFEEATAKLVRGHRFDTDSSCEYCPDVSTGGSVFMESKASGRGNRVIVYRDRIKRELDWCRENRATIYYYIWRHSVWTKTVSTERDLHIALAKSTREVVVVDLSVLFNIASELPVKCINNRHPLWSHGWQIKVEHILAYKTPQIRVRRQLNVLGTRIRNLVIKTIPDDDPF